MKGPLLALATGALGTAGARGGPEGREPVPNSHLSASFPQILVLCLLVETVFSRQVPNFTLCT